MNVSGVTNVRLSDLSFDVREDAGRAYVSQEGLRSIAANDAMAARLRGARDRAETDALKNLARYKFSNFGYHAARWVTLNALVGDRQANPFKALVELARRLSQEARG